MSLAGKDVIIKISGEGVVATDLPTVTTDNKTYQIADTLKQVITYNTPVIVKDGGQQIEEKYKINRLLGIIEFETEKERDITIDCTYLPLVKVAEAHVASYTEATDLHEVPQFGDTHKRRIPGLRYASGSLNTWDILDTTFTDALTSGKPVVLEVKPSVSEGKTKRLFALLESTEMSLAIDNPHEQSVSFISTDEFIRY
ncbi:hypothetical protein TSYNTROOL_14370 [Tepidanaerobacter syntrophicus]|uniref:hypothetical protein n=1 Tax=Tepidanaerobacter syntrophicus TaxID=224999 RepID=UPI0022EF6148|nr:hypothetical protein [Tepidanaerobacter syntrophicus]GLI51351.1 hypothetical protein TSYNTROOL_14370 [Tepidanaerobacter syntrophicus]